VPPATAVSAQAYLAAGHICLDILYDHGAWSPALTIASVARSLLSMLAANQDKTAPAGDDDYCRRVGDSSSRRTRWTFHDDQV
jgi:ubiquitin-protein ligase